MAGASSENVDLWDQRVPQSSQGFRFRVSGCLVFCAVAVGLRLVAFNTGAQTLSNMFNMLMTLFFLLRPLQQFCTIPKRASPFGVAGDSTC